MNAENTDLGPYRLLQCLGEGGAGRVFKARHRRMNRTVAVKVIHKELLGDAEVVGRFYREIQIVSQLNHPNIVHALDGGPVGGVHLLVMEYAEGIDLDHLVKKSGPLAVPKACDIMRQAALGLQHIHERGLVHRDIKPSNLILCKLRPRDSGLGTIKILDLGLGRLHEGVHGKTKTRLPDGNSLTTLTLSSSVTMGTVDYMAPEQALDFHAADIRADIYSLGCVLYFLLTGKPPFEGTMAVKLMRHQQAEPPDLTQIRPQAPTALVEVVRRMLAKRPDARYQTPGEVAAAMDALLGPSAPPPASNSQTTAVPRRTGSKSRAKLLTLAGAGVVATALGLLTMLPTEPVEPVAAVGSQPRRSPATPPAAVATQTRLSLATLPQSPPQTPPEQPSPLDRWDPRTIPASSMPANAPKQLVAIFGEDCPALLSVAFGSDGKVVAAGGNGGLHVWDAGTGKATAAPPTAAAGSSVHALAIAPQGTSFAAAGSDRRVRICDWQSNGLQGTIDRWDRTSRSRLQYSPDGNTLAALDDKGAVKVWDVTLKQLRHTVAVPGEAASCAAFAPDGRTLAVGCSSGVKFVDVASGTLQGSLDLPAAVHAAAYSPDGRHLAVNGIGTAGTEAFTFIKAYSLASKELIQDMDTGAGPKFPPRVLQFSRDGTKLVCLMDLGKVLWWEWPGGKLLGNWRGGAADIALAPDSRHLATAHSNGRVCLIRLTTSTR